ncbi:MAG: Transcriptional regulator, YafY family [Ktedonobacterales bacterium]|jgi:predicted DNA-binding transcriptional regulator YafY|nr:MAG: Transcriptional regulator, YafY family [Ktedonobacterales bacterium]
MRADRLLSLLLILQARGRTTARELAERLEVSERTVYRDLSALGIAGVPVYAERGPGGCGLLEGYRTTLTGLSELEVRTLFLSGAARPLADLGMGSALEGALLKLLAALPARLRADAERARRRIHVDAAGWGNTDEETPFLGLLQEALWQDRCVRVTYRRGDGEVVERVMQPLGLVAKASIWYLVARTERSGDAGSDNGADGNEPRVYRVSRIRAAEMADARFERAGDFDLASFWAASASRFVSSWGQYPVLVRVAPDLLPNLHHYFGESIYDVIAQAGPPDGEGWTTLPLMFQTMEGARTNLLGMGAEVEVLEPPELCASIASYARAIAAFYAERAEG